MMGSYLKNPKLNLLLQQVKTHSRKHEKKEVDGQVIKGIFEFVPYDPQTMIEIRLFKSRFIG